jgi:glucose-1-phosphate thymidylyltransferase
MHAFILAGGFATRLWPLTERRAKPLLPLAGLPIISHLVEKIPSHIPITISTNQVFAEDFEKWKFHIPNSKFQILLEDTGNDDHKLGALGATAQWIQQQSIEEDVLLFTGDNYCGFSINDFLSHAKPGQALLAAHDIGNLRVAQSFGTVILDDNGDIRAFEEKPKEPKTTLVSTGCSLLPSEVLPVLVEYAQEHPDNVGGIFEELLQRNQKIGCYTFREPWFDIGSFDAYLEATKTLVGNNALVDASATVEQSVLEGANVLGARSTVQRSTLHNVVLFENCTVEDCVLENCVIDNECRLQGVDLTGKMLREGTIIP